MRISDWSSDVCSSDLRLERTWPRRLVALAGAEADARGVRAAARHARRLHADPLPRQARRGCAALQSNRQLHGRPVHGMAGPAPGAVPAQDGLDRFGLIGDAACGPRHSPSCIADVSRSEEHTSELQSLMRISYAVFCLKKK